MTDGLDTGLLRNVGYVSCARLYRDFYSITGHTVKEYVRKRRLSNALALIKTSDMGLTDIAFQCGYSSHQALCRAIRQTLGITPSEYKKNDIYYFFPPWSGEPLQSVVVSGETIPRAQRVLFYHSNLTNIENTAVGTFLQAFPDYNGRIFGRNGEQVGNKLCYELYMTDTGRDYNKLNTYGFIITHETSCFTATFATSTVRINERNINAAWDYLYSEEFYLRKETDAYICGVRVKSELRIAGAENIESVRTNPNNYLILESRVAGDYDRYADMLLTFACDNGMTADKPGIFAVYDAQESFDNPRIKIYCPVKIEKN